MAQWLAVDSQALSQTVLRTLETLDGNTNWNIVDTSLGFPCKAELPEYCLLLTENDSFVLELLRHNIRSYGLPGGYLLIVWLLNPHVNAPTTFGHLSPIAARRVLHKWKNSAMPNVSLTTIISDVLLPLEALGYLEKGDCKYLQDYAVGTGTTVKHKIIAREITRRIIPKLRRYLS